MDSGFDEAPMPAGIDDGRRGGRGWTIALLALLAFLGGVLATGWAARRWSAAAALIVPTPATVPVRVVSVPVPAAPAGPVAPDPALARQVDAIDAKLDAVDARARAADRGADRAEELLVAFAARRVIERGVDLGYIEGLLRDHFGATEPQAVATIISAARRPVTIAGLRTGLAGAEGALVQGEAGDTGWAAFRRELSNLLVLRRNGSDSTAPVDRFARATTAIEAGEVDLALAEVSRMPGQAGAAEWITEARRYIAVRNALDRLETAALVANRPGLDAIP